MKIGLRLKGLHEDVGTLQVRVRQNGGGKTTKEYWGVRDGRPKKLGQNGTVSDIAEVIGETERTTKRILKLNDLIPRLRKRGSRNYWSVKKGNSQMRQNGALKTVGGDHVPRRKQPSQVPPLDERHYLAIELMSRPFYDRALGRNRWLTKQEIADLVGISRMQLYRWEQRKDFQREKEKRVKAYARSLVKTRKSYADLALNGDIKAFETIVNLMKG